MRVLIMGSPTSEGMLCFNRNSGVYGGGWVENLVNELKGSHEIELFVAFYADFAQSLEIKELNEVSYCSLPIRVPGLNSCNEQMCEDLRRMLQIINPDVVHIMGTEREHDLRLLELAGKDKTVASITGMVSYCAKHYFGGVDSCEFSRKTLGDIIRRGGPLKERNNFLRFGQFEKKMISELKYVTGRTTWDYACVKQINPKVEYIYCGEILNPIFFQHKWDLSKTKRHRIFVSQGTYPLKGFHMLLEAFPIVLKKYPDAEIVVAGQDILTCDSAIKKIKQTTYSRYLQKLIRNLQIPTEKVTYTGMLNAQGMLSQYMQCNVFVLPSSIENSPNSLGEAMLLGVPCVASCVGGVQDMLRDKIDGYLYPFDEPYMLAYYICDLFENDVRAQNFGANAKQTALKRFDSIRVKQTTLEVYRKIAKSGGNNEYRR